MNEGQIPLPGLKDRSRRLKVSEEAVQDRIVHRLAYSGFVVEVTAFPSYIQRRMNAAGMGATRQSKGIGDVLVYRVTYAHYLGIKGVKLNGEIKPLEKYTFSSEEQEVACRDGGIVVWWNEEMALRDCLRFDELVAKAAGVPVELIRDPKLSRGRIGHVTEAQVLRAKRETERNRRAYQRERLKQEKALRVKTAPKRKPKQPKK